MKFIKILNPYNIILKTKYTKRKMKYLKGFETLGDIFVYDKYIYIWLSYDVYNSLIIGYKGL